MMTRAMAPMALALLLAAPGAGAQQPQGPPPATTKPPAPCAAPESRQFDFWIGDWDVFVGAKLVGTNRIVPIYDCVLHEHWKTPRMEGQSFNRFDTRRKVWHQTWVDSAGTLLLIEGGWRDGTMTMSDRGLPGKTNPDAINEIAWSTRPDGSVRQLWRTSRDGGKTWAVAFDGRYVRSSRPQPK